MPEDLSKAIPHVKRMMEAFRIPVLQLDGYEADDIIGTLAKRAEAEGGFTTWMVTADKDFAQLVDERTFMWKPGRQGGDHEVIGVAEVQAQWLVERPEQVIDILGLWGDASDNIPGVPGIGEKTAKSLIQQFGSIENILANLDKLKGKQKENLATYAEQARLSRDLATIQLDVPIDIDLAELIRQPLNEDAVQSLLVEFEFNAVGRRLFGENFRAGRGFHRREENAVPDAAGSATAAPPVPILHTHDTVPHAWTIADSAKSRATALAKALEAGITGFAVDWQGSDARSSEIRGIALAPAAHEAFYLTGADPAALTAEEARGMAIGETEARIEALNKAIATADDKTAAFLQALSQDQVKFAGDKVFVMRDDKGFDPVTGAPLDVPADAEDVINNNMMRGEIEAAVTASSIGFKPAKKAGAFMRYGWLDPQRRQFTAHRIAVVRDAAPARLEELDAMQRAHAEIYRAAPLSDAPEVWRSLRATLDLSGVADDPV